ncbi:MAG: Piwi domain-containing protein [Clostridium sp.]|nr:hypothetical protein [Clostridium sp.]
MNKITFEAFEGIGKVTPKVFYKYNLKGKGNIENVNKVISSARYGLSSNNGHKFVGIKGDVLLFVEKLENIPQRDDVDIIFAGEEELDILENKQIYEDLIVYYINNAVRWTKINNERKYRAANNRDITCNFVLDRASKESIVKSKKGFELKRKFRINPVITDDLGVILYVSCSAEFSYDKNIYQMMKLGFNVIGLEVKNTWSTINSSGVIEEISDLKVNEPCTLGQSLIDYYISRNQEYRIKDFTEEDKNANVIVVRFKKKTFNFIPHALAPIITREYLSREDVSFSKEIEQLVKMDMGYRYKILKNFIKDIGPIKELNNMYFNDKYIDDISKLGYKSGNLVEPRLIGANGVIKNKMQIFKNGFYKMPQKKVCFGVLYPEEYEEESKKAIRAIYDFATEGKYQGTDNKYIANNLMNILFDPSNCIFEKYKSGDIREYKKVAQKVKEYNKVEFVIAIIPDLNDESEENPYNPFKKVWAEKNIPSQMISVKTAKILKDSKSNTGLYYLHNIILGILGKIGGIPWAIDNMEGNIDCFIGLDVGTREKGIHHPACSVLFDKHGELINYYKPVIPQSGEIIENNILQEIFDNVLNSYEEKYKELPKNIVIHRDGFSRENLNWYENYFGKYNIKFNIIEVRKKTSIKLANINNNIIKNPEKSIYVVNENKAYVITTDIKENLGSPRPLKIEKTYGYLDMITILNQIYALSQIHVGSTKSMRLPITTGYADKICKAIEFIPQGVLDNKLYFL